MHTNKSVTGLFQQALPSLKSEKINHANAFESRTTDRRPAHVKASTKVFQYPVLNRDRYSYPTYVPHLPPILNTF